MQILLYISGLVLMSVAQHSPLTIMLNACPHGLLVSQKPKYECCAALAEFNVNKGFCDHVSHDILGAQFDVADRLLRMACRYSYEGLKLQKLKC